MADQRITQLTALPKAGVAATDVLPIADISASQTKKVTAKDLVDAGLDLIDVSSIDLDKLDQASTTKLGTAALADDAVTAAKLANDSSTAVQTTTPASDNFEGRGYYNSTSGNLQVFNGSAYQQVVMPTAGIGDLQVTTGKLADGAVTTAKVTALATAAYADSSVTTAKIADGAVTAVKIATDSITATQVAPNAIGASELADNAVDTAAVVNLAVTAAKLGDGAVVEAKLGDLAVTNAKIANTTIAYGKLNLADGSIPGAKIAADSIAAGQIAANAVDTSELVDSAVTTGKLANNAVTAAKIAVDAITANEIAAGAIGTSELAGAAVTYDKLQNVSATDRLLGRTSAGAGSVEEISCTAAGRALLDDADAATQRATLGLGTIATGNGTWTDGGSFSGTSSGTNTGDQTITLTGDVTGTGTGSFATAIATSAVTENAIATDAVTTGKVLDGAITAAKLDDDSAAIVAAASPSGTGAFIGQQWFNTNNSQEFTWTGSAWVQQAGIGTINIVDSTPIAIAVSYPDAYSATLTATLDTQTAATVFAGPTSGADAAPTFRAIVPTDIPDATVSTKGIIQPGTGLAVDSGTLNHTNAVTGATVSSITFDNQGHITAAIPLVAADIPVLDASTITTGEFPTARLADNAVTGAKLADYTTSKIGEVLPVADHIGQFFFNPLEGSVFLWDGNVWQPVGVTTGAIILAGTYDATDNEIISTTLEGAAIGLTAGSPLPSATNANANYYVVVAVGGTGTAPAPVATLAPPDLILSTGSIWVEIDVSAGAGAIAAVNVVFSAIGEISATNVQLAIEEVSTECRNADNITSGTLAVARGGTGLASYAKGDILGASAATTLTKLTVGTNGQVLRANSATATGLEWSNDFVGTVTTVTSSTAALTVATASTTPALTIRSATTSVNGIVQLSDSTSTTSSVLAATPTAVKSAYDLAALALPKAGGTVTGDITLGTNVGIQFEGTTDDANEIRLIGADATADRTITLPNATGTVVLSGAIVNADINDSAAIVDTKLATISTAGKVSGTAITSGAIGTSGSMEITNTSPALRLTESDGTSTNNKTSLIRNSDTFVIGTRNSTDSLVSADYSIPSDASGATDHVWRVANAEELRLNSTGLGIGTSTPSHRLEVARLGADLAITGVDTNTAILATAGGGTTTSGAAITLAGGTASACSVLFGDTADGDVGGIIYSNTDDSLAFRVNAAERMRIRSDGNIGIGGGGAVSVTLYNQGAITGSTTAYGNFTNATVQSDVTTSAFVNRTAITTAAAAFTAVNLYHYSAGISTLGAASAVTNNIGFFAEGNLGSTSAAQVTAVFGFRSDIASATGRWNFYAVGAAPNYFAGDIRTNGASTKITAATDSATSVTLTAASIIDGIRSGTPTASINYTLPTGTNLDAAFQDLQSGQSFEWSVINRASVTFNITVVANTNHTVFGNMVTGPASSGRFLTRKSTTDTFVTYRIG